MKKLAKHTLKNNELINIIHSIKDQKGWNYINKPKTQAELKDCSSCFAGLCFKIQKPCNKENCPIEDQHV